MGARGYDRIARAIEFVARHANEHPSLDALSAHLGLSPHHVQRLFKRFAGVSPKRFLQALTAAHARERLRESATVLNGSYDVGLSGPGRLHDLLVAVDAVTPGEVRRMGEGLEIRHGVHDTPFGQARIGLTQRGVCHLAFVGAADADPDGALRRAWPRATLTEDPHSTGARVARIFAPWSEDARPLPLLLRGTNLQLQVWRALLRIPEGAVVSYGGLADALGRPRAARAVAGAVAANPIGWLIPCHRVLRATGAIGGYRWGETRKRAILGLELAEHRTSCAV